MKYLHTREIYLSTLNEAFENDITWGGSLLGRLINSIIRKAKIGVNYLKIDSIANAIKNELDLLIMEGLPQDIKEEVMNSIPNYLLEAIYNCVIEEKDDKEKLSELLDKNETSDDENSTEIKETEIGLISTAIEYIKTLSDDVKIGPSDKNTLIEKLEKFRSELEKINNVDTTEDKEIDIDFYNETINLLKSIIELDNIINKKSLNAGDENNNLNINNIKTKEPEKINASYLCSYYDFINEESHNIKLKGKSPFNKSSSSISNGAKNNNDYYKEQPETDINKSKNNLDDVQSEYDDKNEEPEVRQNNTGVSKPSTATNKVSNIDSKTIWNNILTQWKKVEVESYIPTINELINSDKKIDVIKVGQEIINKRKTHGIPLEHDKLDKNVKSFDNLESVISDISKIILSLKGKENIIDELPSKDAINSFIVSFDKMSETYKEEPVVLDNEHAEEHEMYRDSYKFHSYRSFLKLNEEENTSLENTDNKTDIQNIKENNVKSIWFNNFKEGEEKEWKIDETKAKELQTKCDSSKTIINTNTSKDRIIKIANLFGKAYRCFVKQNIPSGRPDGKVSNKTYNEYIYVGGGNPSGGPNNPGHGPWASKVVFHKFADKISELIEDNKYKKIFNNMTINRTDNKKVLKGNVLLEFIRNMIDENTLKSYSKNRTTLLNKYFGLEIGDTDNKDNLSLHNNTDVADATEKMSGIYWAPVTPIDDKTNSEVGSFIAICCLSEKEEKSEKIIGHILKKDSDGNILIKYQIGFESIPINYGNDIDLSRRYTTHNSKIDAPVYLGAINLRNTPIIENVNNPKVFKISRRQLIVEKNKLKPTNYEILGYKPNRKVTPSGKVARTKFSEPMAVLKTNDDKGYQKTIINNNFKSFPNKLMNDFDGIDIDEEFKNAILKLNSK